MKIYILQTSNFTSNCFVVNNSARKWIFSYFCTIWLSNQKIVICWRICPWPQISWRTPYLLKVIDWSHLFPLNVWWNWTTLKLLRHSRIINLDTEILALTSSRRHLFVFRSPVAFLLPSRVEFVYITEVVVLLPGEVSGNVYISIESYMFWFFIHTTNSGISIVMSVFFASSQNGEELCQRATNKVIIIINQNSPVI